MIDFTAINTTGVQASQIGNVYPLIDMNVTPNQMFFQVELDDFDEENHRKVCNVRFVDGTFKGSCGDNCEHTLWAVAFIKENKVGDYFDEDEAETLEVLDRKEFVIGMILKQEYQVQDGASVRSITIWPSIAACSCGFGANPTDEEECNHIEAARHFEAVHQAELADYHGC
jgi:hypothetical protein